ncbi:MAG: pyrroline-5-carboxylate reductase [Lentisphaerae bacterium]|nr:pyrroline-5-carboxylate reductase [Lentisphaerota bacterium]
MTIGFLGSGKMAEAILAALLCGGGAKAGDLMACDVAPDRLRMLRQRYRVPVTESPEELLRRCDVVVLAVKPQDLDALLRRIAPAVLKRHLLISIAAGKTLAGMQGLVGAGTRLVRVMPNLGLMVGAGMSAYCLGTAARAADGRTVRKILGAAGRVVELAEAHFDAVTALSGSGPAFFAYAMQALADGAAAQGLPAATARELAAQTMFGAAKVLIETAQAPETFIRAVASPKGTTAEGLAVLEKSALRGILARTIRAAARRSAELSRI